ncbi:MAG: hypothetical protein L0207_04495 [Chlamydiae bacterium]|nr:hypothetical protein [Chlamydiota bacterium]
MIHPTIKDIYLNHKGLIEEYERTQDLKTREKIIKSRENNQNAISEIIKNGWPKKSIIGEVALDALWYLIQDTSLDFQKKCLTLSRKAAEKGEPCLIHVGYLEDRITIMEMYLKDRDLREKYLRTQDPKDRERLIESRMDNQPVISEIIKNGWPKVDIIGREASEVLWSLVQDVDLELQEKCFPLLKFAVVRGDVSLYQVAYLIDRISLKKTGGQVYGTQYQIENGKILFEPILDMGKIDKYRSEMKLNSFEEFKKQIAKNGY